MSSIVLDLQRDCLDPKFQVSDLLRKALLIARKLKQIDFEEYLNNEIDGYQQKCKVPDYRIVHGEVKAFNPYHGWVPVFFSDQQMAEMLRQRPISSSIVELEDLLSGEKKGTTFQVPFSPEIESKLMDGANLPLKPTLHVGTSQVRGILERVRKIILDWTLKLEDQKIFGENMQSSNEEVKTAESPQYTVQNFFGPVSGSQIQQGGSNSPQTYNNDQSSNEKILELIKEIKKEEKNLNLPPERAKELTSEIQTIEAQIASPKPKATIISESLKSTRNILEGTTGSLIAAKLHEILHGVI